mmetsp:Transcript_37315/g.90902  ORF Transcript_37315/g.90902 Transcript_37315/m.90902 type:complete len:339 (+) Transcript_37315:46-1062(+)
MLLDALQRRFSLASPSELHADDDFDQHDVHIGRLACLTTIYSLAEGTLTYPYDVVKTRQQIAVAGSPASQLTTASHILRLFQEAGFRGLYRGFGCNVLGGIPSEVAYYVGYTQAKAAMLSTPLGRQNPSAVYLIAGAMSDVLSVLLWVPADLISQRLMIAGAHEPLSRCSCALLPSANASGDPATAVSTLQSTELTSGRVIRDIIKSEGLLGLWKGAGVTMASYAPNSAVWWLTHEEAKARISSWQRTSDEHIGVLGASGAMAGITSTIATNPLDVVKTRVQCSNEPRTALQVFRDLLRESGLRGLYSGLSPRLLAAVPRSVCAVLAYEKAVAFCRKE